uniref:Zinc finger CCHC domain-containing protein 8 n=1 Tax=Mola mola TaxID=94237 RepID=A0A3Q3WVJ3_MOLML
MAEVDFGDSELFEQLDDSAPRVSKHIRFTDDEEDHEEISHLRNRLEECDDYIQRLIEENILVGGAHDISIEDVNFDGPVLQILYTNNSISNIYCYFKCFVHYTIKSKCDVVGSVLYFTTFTLDKLGQPLVNENPQLTDGWDVPTYHQVFNQVIGTDGLEIEMKDKRPKSVCFNCGSAGHQLRDCPKPKDMAAISERRKEFNQNNNQAIQTNQRYHAEEVEERFAKYKPGFLSEELLAALGIDGNTLPPLIYRMRQLGYPPGWLKEAEMENSGLTLYDGNGMFTNSQNISYDVSKLIDFPGFNVPATHRMRDYGSIPMQNSHMKQNFAAYLSNNFPTVIPGTISNKRPYESDSSPQLRKKTRRHIIDCHHSPPPLPQGTPPATPTPPPLPKGTPPPTPTNGSPALPGQSWVVVDEAMERPEDDLTLEELEEQQRLIWAALENADTGTSSDCETPALGTPVPSSPCVSTPAHMDTETEEVEEPTDPMESAETCRSRETHAEAGCHEDSQERGPVVVEEDSPQSPEPVRPQSPGPVKAQDESPQSPDPNKCWVGSHQSTDPFKCQEENPQSPVPDFDGPGDWDSPKHVDKVTAIPHRSNFAAGIVPFEDTPEFTEVAAATGTYLKIRDLLKGSPRNLAKKK